MIRTLLLGLMILFMTTEIEAQSKKELKADVDRLNAELSQKDEELRAAKNSEKISVANAAEYEAQVKELQAANATLLENLKKWTESSQQRSETIGQTLQSLREKERVLKLFQDEFSKNDSIAYLLIADFKGSLGENALIGIKEGQVAVELSTPGIFGNNQSAAAISESGKSFLGKIAAAVKKYPDMDVTVLTMVGTADQSATPQQRALAIKGSLGDTASGTADRVGVAFKQAGSTSYEVRFHPNYHKFYALVKETLKISR